MSARQFTLEYIIKVTGGGAAAGQINQINNSLKATSPALKQTASGFTEVEKSSHRLGQTATRTTSHMKGIAFGLIGLTSAGVEAVGMLGMWADTARRTEEAQQALTDATAQYGADSTQATRATQELTKAQRFQAMTQRNLILSMFDMVPFTLLLVNGIREQLILTKQLRAAQITSAAAQATAATAERARVVSQLALVGSTNTLIGSHFRLTPQLLATAVATGGITTANIGYTASTVTAGAATSRLGAIMSSTWIKVLGPIAVVIGGVVAAMILYKTNAGGFATATDRMGVAIGNAVPMLKGLLTRIKNIAVAFPNVGEMFKAALGLGGSGKKDTDELAKALEELDTKAKELLNTMAFAKKGERKDLLSAIGIKGGAAKRFKPILNDIEDITKSITRLGDALLFSQQMTNLSKFIELPASMFKKMAFTFEDVFNDIANMDIIKGTKFETIFEDLATQLETDAKKTNGKNFQKIIAEAFMNHPEMLAMFSAMGMPPELISTIQTMMDQEAAKIRGRFNLPKVTETQKSKFLEDIGMEQPVNLPQVNQVVNLTDPQGNSLFLAGVAGGGSNITTIVQNYLNQIFSPGAWHDAITKYLVAGNIITGIWMDTWNSFEVEMNKISGTTSIVFTGLTIAANWVTGFLDAFFNAGLIHGAIGKYLAAGTIVQGILTDVATQLADAISKAGEKGGLVATGVDVVKKAIEALFNPSAEGAEPTTTIKPNVEVEPTYTLKESDSRFGGAKTLSEFIANTLPDPMTLIPPDIIIAPTPNATPTIPPISVPTITVQPKTIQIAYGGGPQFQDPNKNPGNSIIGGGGGAGVFSKSLQLLQISVPSITVTPETINFDTAGTQFTLLQQAFFKLSQDISTVWNTTMISISSLAGTAAIAITQQLNAMVVSVSAGMTGLANTWSAICNSFGANASSGGNQIINNMDSAISQVTSMMSQLASHWSKMCNSMIANAKSAAKGIISALNKIPRRIDVTVHVGVEGPGVKFMAKGFHGTVNTPTLMMVGEAGPERVDISKSGSPGTGLMVNRDMNITPELAARNRNAVSVGGDTVVQVFIGGRQIKPELVQILASNQMTMK